MLPGFLQVFAPSLFNRVSVSFGIRRRASKPGGQKFYAVHRGRNGFRGVLSDWSSCSRVVSGVSNAVFKSFSTRAAAAAFAEHGRLGQSSTRHTTGTSAAGTANRERAISRSVSVSSAVGKPAEQPSGITNVPGKIVTVYTDGACVKNGQSGAAAGVGVFFGDGISYNVSEKLVGPTQTNQRAEQTAVLRALQVAQSEGLVADGDRLHIKTDSKYTMTGVTTWVLKWKRNSWKTAGGGDVKNADLWKAIDTIKKELEEGGVLITFEWVKGHSGMRGNEQADALAVRGVRGV